MRVNNGQTNKIYTCPPHTMCVICDVKSCISPSGFSKPMKLSKRSVILYSHYWSFILGGGGGTSFEGPHLIDKLTHLKGNLLFNDNIWYH